MRNLLVASSVLAAMATAMPAQADNPWNLHTAEYGSEGCPEGWALVAIHGRREVHVCLDLATVMVEDTLSPRMFDDAGPLEGVPLMPDGTRPMASFLTSYQHPYEDIRLVRGLVQPAELEMLACPPGSYARRITHLGNEMLCSLGPVADTRFPYQYLDGLYSLSVGAPGLVQSPTQWTLDDGSTAHGCSYRQEPTVVIGIHEVDNQLLCAPLRPIALP